MKWLDKWRKSNALNKEIERKYEILLSCEREIKTLEEKNIESDKWCVEFGISGCPRMGIVPNLDKETICKVLKMIKTEIEEDIDSLKEEFERTWNH